MFFQAPKSCPLTDWSDWSSCSSYCFGQSIRVRRPEKQHMLTLDNLKKVSKIYRKIQSRQSIYDKDIVNLNFTSIQDATHDCANLTLIESKMCNDEYTDCLADNTPDNEPPKMCLLPPLRGECGEPPEIHFYFNSLSNDCGMFMFTGCNGSLNNFETYDQCHSECMGKKFKIKKVK